MKHYTAVRAAKCRAFNAWHEAVVSGVIDPKEIQKGLRWYDRRYDYPEHWTVDEIRTEIIDGYTPFEQAA